MPGLKWKSAEHRSKEWEIAKKHLQGGGVPEGTKLQRSKGILRKKSYSDNEGHEHKIKHSFIVVNGEILALSGHRVVLGQGISGKVKLAENEGGHLYAVKIGHQEVIKQVDLVVPVEPIKQSELKILADAASQGVQSTR
ncbi:hypothetical protein [Piscirickettsia salmonis]|uniref:hypothetical protein n=1 Tax=Piscirickettsia salmonis TaxID=1238 RepID=UPI003A80931D